MSDESVLYGHLLMQETSMRMAAEERARIAEEKLSAFMEKSLNSSTEEKTVERVVEASVDKTAMIEEIKSELMKVIPNHDDESQRQISVLKNDLALMKTSMETKKSEGRMDIAIVERDGNGNAFRFVVKHV